MREPLSGGNFRPTHLEWGLDCLAASRLEAELLTSLNVVLSIVEWPEAPRYFLVKARPEFRADDSNAAGVVVRGT